jgi:glycosyltransferase involved in cell wall biosynthesis
MSASVDLPDTERTASLIVEKSPRVLQVIYSFEVGGSEMVGREIALDLRQAGVETAVCALTTDGALRAELEQQGVRTFVVGRRPGEMASAMWRLARFIRLFAPEIVHTHHVGQLIYSLPGALISRSRILHTEHEYYSLQRDSAGRRLRRLARFCSGFTAVNDETRDYLIHVLKLPAQRVSTVRNGIDLDRFGGATPDRESLGLTPDDRAILIVARLEPVKGHAVLLHAFRQLLESVPNAVLLLAGDGSLRSSLESLAANLGIGARVRFLGTRRDIPNLLAATDAFVLSSLEEGLPMSVLEAMAARTPVVATAVGGLPSVIRPGETGWLVPPDNATALAAGLAAALTGPDRVQRVEGAVRLVADRYDVARTRERYRQIYSSLLVQ